MPDNHVTEGQFVEYIQEAATQMNKIDDKINQVEKITAFNSKGNVPTYADLAAIENPQLNDAYGVIADGLTYIYNGTSFPTEGNGMDLGLKPNGVVSENEVLAVSGMEVFQSTLTKEQYLNDDFNLLKNATRTSGKYINSEGQEVANSLFSYFTVESNSGVLFLEADLSLIGISAYGAYFDENDNYLTGITTTTSQYLINSNSTKIALITPPGTKTVKLSVISASIDSCKLYDGLYSYPSNVGLNDNLLNKLVRLSERVFIDNLLRNETFYKWFNFGYFRVFNDALEIVSSNIFNSTGLIPVDDNDSVIVENWLQNYNPSDLGTRGQWFDQNKKLIDYLPNINEETPSYTAVLGAKYVSVVYEKAIVSDLSVKVVASNSDLKLNANSLLQKTEYVTPWQGLRMTSFGDSITYQNMWQTYVVEKLGMIHTNLGIGSTCMINAGPTPMSTDERIQAIIDSNPDVVSLLAGANDLLYCVGGINAVPGASVGDESEFSKSLVNKDKLKFYGAYSYVIEKLLEWKPTLRIIILGTTWAHNNGATYNTTLRYSDFAEASKKIAEHYSLVFIDTHSNVGFNKFTMGESPNDIYSEDQIHPNSLGGKRMAEVVLAKLNSISVI